MLGLEDFAKGFNRGVAETRYLTFEEAVDANDNEPVYNPTSFESMGYHDGYMYGVSLAFSGNGKDCKSLEAEIDKCHTHALKAYNNSIVK